MVGMGAYKSASYRYVENTSRMKDFREHMLKSVKYGKKFSNLGFDMLLLEAEPQNNGVK